MFGVDFMPWFDVADFQYNQFVYDDGTVNNNFQYNSPTSFFYNENTYGQKTDESGRTTHTVREYSRKPKQDIKYFATLRLDKTQILLGDIVGIEVSTWFETYRDTTKIDSSPIPNAYVEIRDSYFDPDKWRSEELVVGIGATDDNGHFRWTYKPPYKGSHTLYAIIDVPSPIKKRLQSNAVQLLVGTDIMTYEDILREMENYRKYSIASVLIAFFASIAAIGSYIYRKIKS